MQKETTNAIKGSIAKWDLIAQGILSEKGVDNCPLCKIFYRPEANIPHYCTDCPVYKKTSKDSCQQTPWEEILLDFHVSLPGWIKDQEHHFDYINETIDAVEDEIEFLILLLPLEEQGAYKL